jgi:hypothetical protein
MDKLKKEDNLLNQLHFSRTNRKREKKIESLCSEKTVNHNSSRHIVIKMSIINTMNILLFNTTIGISRKEETYHLKCKGIVSYLNIK